MNGLTQYEKSAVLKLVANEMNKTERDIKILEREKTLHRNLNGNKSLMEAEITTEIKELQNHFEFLKRIYEKLNGV